MGCTDYCTDITALAENFMVLLGLMLYKAFFFMIFLSASIGPSVLVCHVYNYFFHNDPLPYMVEPMLFFLLLRYWAQFSVTVENRTFKALLESWESKHPNTMTFGGFTIDILVFIFTFWGMYGTFICANTFTATADSHTKRRHFTGDGYGLQEELSAVEAEGATTTNSLIFSVFGVGGDRSSSSEDIHTTKGGDLLLDSSREVPTTLFKLSLAYLVFITTRQFHTIVVRTMKNIPSPAYSIMSHFNLLLRIGFIFIHLLVNTLYFLPCVAIGLTASNYRTMGGTLYLQLAFTAALAGMIAALVELNRPWPRLRGKMPNLYFENNIIAKDKLSVVLIFLILMTFYGALTHKKVSDVSFDSTNRDMVFFSMSVSFAILHIVKFCVHALLTLAQDFDDERARRQRMIENEELMFTPSVRSLAGGTGGVSSEGPSPPRSLPLVEHIIGPDGICQRCTENRLNNNYPTRPVTYIKPQAPSADNNNNIERQQQQLLLQQNSDNQEETPAAAAEVPPSTEVENCEHVQSNRQNSNSTATAPPPAAENIASAPPAETNTATATSVMIEIDLNADDEHTV